MSMVHLSRGSLPPPGDRGAQRGGDHLPAGPRGCSGPTHPVPWERFAADYDSIRDAIAAVVPGLRRLQPPGARSPTASSCRTRRAIPANSPPATGKANFAVNPLEWVPVPPGRLVLQTLRSHDQYNTTIYGLDDRYRGVKGGRRVVFVNPADIDALRADRRRPRRPGLGVHRRRRRSSQERRAKDFLVVPYSDTGRQRRRLLSGDQPAGAAGSRCGQVEYAGVEGDRRSDWRERRETDGPGDRAPPGEPRRPPDGADRAGRDPRRRGAAGDPGQRHPGHRHHAHARLGCRTGTRLSAHRGRDRPHATTSLTVQYCRGRRTHDGVEHLQRARRDAAPGRAGARRRRHPQLLHHLVVRGVRQGLPGRGPADQPPLPRRRPDDRVARRR